MKRKELLIVAGNMVRFGGSFVESLGQALFQADEENAEKIKKAFPGYWKQYSEDYFIDNAKEMAEDYEPRCQDCGHIEGTCNCDKDY